jgi:phage shock protein A
VPWWLIDYQKREATMGIMTRMAKIFKADIHGFMDQFEDQGLLLKQHLRDMQEALAAKEISLKTIQVTRQQIRQELDKFSRQREPLERDLGVAIQADKDDTARMLIRKITLLNDLTNAMTHRIETLDQEIAGIKDHLDQQRLQYEQIKHRAAGYFHQAELQHWKKNPSTVSLDYCAGEPAQAEIELELIQRKEILRTGGIR